MTLRTFLKIAVVAAIAAAVAAVWFSPLKDHLTRDGIRSAVENVRGVWYGPAVLSAVYAVGVALGLPATLFILVAGVIWGWAVGGVFAMIGGLGGAAGSYCIGRFVGEGMLGRLGRTGRAVEKRLESASFRSFLLLRLVPFVPFPVLNYAAGVARIRFRHFIAATAISLAPGTFVFAYSADALVNGTLSEGEAVQRVLIAAGLVFLIVLIPGLLKKFFADQVGPIAS
ncbi:MAG TPA: VTT domain-containing protein [Thermoanaerobaculia bacterium]|nr:VTT domain-containing protein [Thermoanaerobaculia bacterium]